MMKDDFHAVIEPYRSLVSAYCHAFAKSKWDSDELEQAVLLKLYGVFQKKPDMRWTRTYLYRTVKHAWIDSRRAADRRRTVPLDEVQEPERGYAVPDFDVRDAFETLAERLSVRQMVLVLLMDVFGFTAKDTALRVGSTEGAVKEGVKRARATLHRLASEATHGMAPGAELRRQGEPVTRELLERFIEAFRSGNVRVIADAYGRIREAGVRVVAVAVTPNGGSYYFDFRDPDGHLIRLSS